MHTSSANVDSVPILEHAREPPTAELGAVDGPAPEVILPELHPRDEVFFRAHGKIQAKLKRWMQDSIEDWSREAANNILKWWLLNPGVRECIKWKIEIHSADKEHQRDSLMESAARALSFGSSCGSSSYWGTTRDDHSPGLT